MSSRRMKKLLVGLTLCTTGLSGGLFWLAGCGNVSPFSVAQFILGAVSPGTSTGGGTGGSTGSSGFSGVCFLKADEQTMTVEIRNESQAEVNMAVTIFATAGTGGFVCQGHRQQYITFGYQPVILTGSTSKAYGCENVNLDTGTELLARSTRATIPAKGGDPFTSAPPPFDGSTDIPLPLGIVLGDDDVPTFFSCTTIDSCNPAATPCAQGGFVYVAGTVCRIPASRTQGTLCREGGGTNARWVLANPANTDALARKFEYVKGGSIIITILDRAANTNQAVNQIVWNVFDKMNNEIHKEER